MTDRQTAGGRPTQRHALTRLWALDGLRGIAALAVVAYHYLNRGPRLYAELGPEHGWAYYGQYGVHLFFIISGFVIFDSACKSDTRQFFANRVIRLYPAYWVAVILTFSVVAVCGLPGRETSLVTALFNLTMLSGFFNVPYVDGAYWTLTIELSFYIIIGLLARTRALSEARVFITLFVWLTVAFGMRGLAWITDQAAIDVIGHIAYYMPLFVIGIALNKGRSSGSWRLPIAVIVFAFLAIAPGSLRVVSVAVAATALTVAMLYVKLPDRLRPMSDYLGELSYPLYLVHQNIGYVILLALTAWGVTQWGSVAIAATVAVVLATVIAYGFDRPTRRWLRARSSPGKWCSAA